MIINSLYRISSHHQTIEVDDVSMSLNKVSNQILVLQHPLPDAETVKKIFVNRLIGAIVLVDKIDVDAMHAFDSIEGEECKMKVIENFEAEGIKTIICLPESFCTFHLDKQLHHRQKSFKVSVVTLSDRAQRGIYKDESGPLVTCVLQDFFDKMNQKVVFTQIIIADKAEELEELVFNLKDSDIDIFITTGGTGIGPRDITVDTIRPFITKEIPGIMEWIRVKYGATNPAALVSRAIAGTISNCIVFTLPGSPKAVQEYLDEICPGLKHLLFMLHGINH